MKKIRNLCIVAAVCMASAAPTVALADDTDQVTEYSFTDDLVRGDLMRPDGEIFTARRRGDRDSLIRIRENFVAELYKSVENL